VTSYDLSQSGFISFTQGNSAARAEFRLLSIANDPGLVLQLRAAAIQAFEFTYEVSWKMLKRYLEMVAPDPQQIEEMSFTDLIRSGSEKGLLLSDVAIWKIFRQQRGATSHTYDQDKALLVFAAIPKFLTEAKFLLEKLQQRIKANGA
jgi:nucleotidyltransferase substrate binding protein (TIGR01987 family)